MKNELEKFVTYISDICNGTPNNLSIDEARNVVRAINEFLYATDDSLDEVEALGSKFQFFSEFHKYWEANHEKIIDLKIDDQACSYVADALHDVFIRTKGIAFSEVWDACGLKPKEVCRIRMLTANQDFRGSRSFHGLAKIYRDDASLFDVRKINDDPEDFISAIGALLLSQSDKRIQYAKNITNFLIENDSEPYEIIDRFDRDVFALREALTHYQGAGYGNKKTDMFIRDMVVLEIWDNITGFEKIDVASDVNTIKVALRTGIMKSAIPLVSSFMDIFCYQYGYVDEINAKAWRRVWEIWRAKYPDESIDSPCLLDFFVYNVIGKQFCKDILCEYKCDAYDHTFKWHSPKNKTCQVCHRNGERNKAHLILKKMPCTDPDGEIAIKGTDFYTKEIAEPNLSECPFKIACSENGFRMLEPPKSISIMGQTGWTTAYAKKEQGGGGIMA